MGVDVRARGVGDGISTGGAGAAGWGSGTGGGTTRAAHAAMRTARTITENSVANRFMSIAPPAVEERRQSTTGQRGRAARLGH